MNDDIEKWKFAVDNERLIDLVQSGKKKATCSIYDGTCDRVGSKSIITYDNEENACLIETCDNIVCKFNDVIWEVAKLEGETDTLEEWKEIHYNFFKSIDSSFNQNTVVLIEIFKLLDVYDKHTHMF